MDEFPNLKLWDKRWESHRVVWKNLPTVGPKGNETAVRGSALKVSLINQGTSPGQTIPEILRLFNICQTLSLINRRGCGQKLP